MHFFSTELHRPRPLRPVERKIVSPSSVHLDIESACPNHRLVPNSVKPASDGQKVVGLLAERAVWMSWPPPGLVRQQKGLRWLPDADDAPPQRQGAHKDLYFGGNDVESGLEVRAWRSISSRAMCECELLWEILINETKSLNYVDTGQARAPLRPKARQPSGPRYAVDRLLEVCRAFAPNNQLRLCVEHALGFLLDDPTSLEERRDGAEGIVEVVSVNLIPQLRGEIQEACLLRGIGVDSLTGGKAGCND